MRTRFNRWFLNKLSRALVPELRETVLGDLEELKISEASAISELLGLLVRLQTKPWTSWKPWLALFGIVCPITWLLTNLCTGVAFGLSTHALVYWKYGVFYGTGLTGPQEVLNLVCQSSAIVLWSWTAGRVLGALSDGAVWMNWTLLCLVWLFHGKVAYFIRLNLEATVNFSVIYVIFPAVLFLFLLFPAFSGIRLARHRPQLGMKAAILLSATTATLTTLVTLTQGWQLTALQRWSQGAIHYSIPGWEQRLLPLLVLSWPVAYLLMASTRQWRSKVIAV